MKKWTRFLILGAMMFAVGFCFSPAMAQEKPLVIGVDGTFAPHAMPKMGGGV